jgi:phage head maturation protease
LDSHQSTGINNALGRFKETWIRRGALMGKIIFNQTPSGQMAEGMVARGEIAGISAGYAVHAWEIKNSEGRVIDPDNDQVRWDEDLSFEAINWELHEGSLVSVPADSLSGIRSFGSGADRATPEFDQLTDIRARMIVRQRMAERQSASYGNFDD